MRAAIQSPVKMIISPELKIGVRLAAIFAALSGTSSQLAICQCH
jgi:hypothetical protein